MEGLGGTEGGDGGDGGGGGMAREEYRDGTAAAVLRWRGWDSTAGRRADQVAVRVQVRKGRLGVGLS